MRLDNMWLIVGYFLSVNHETNH